MPEILERMPRRTTGIAKEIPEDTREGIAENGFFMLLEEFLETVIF